MGASIFIFMGMSLVILGMTNSRIHICTLTKKGVDILYKLKGLRRYIVNYSDIRNKKIKESILWKEYLIYAIIFDLDGELNEEIAMIYQELIDEK